MVVVRSQDGFNTERLDGRDLVCLTDESSDFRGRERGVLEKTVYNGATEIT